MLIAFAVLVISASGFVEPSVTRSLADEVVLYRYQDAEFSNEESFSDRDGIPNARAYVYKLGDVSLDPSRDYDSSDSTWGVDRYATVITAARYTQNPVVEISNALPAWIANRSRAEKKALELWPGLAPRITGYVYLAPLDEWFEVTTSVGKKFLHSRELVEYDLSTLTSPGFAEACLESSSANHAWQGVSGGGFFLASKSNKISDVPYALWSYGCSPTASSMILDYWDRRGYPLLVDYYFDRWDNVEKETDIDLTNAHRELADGMHTDSMIEGGTGTFSITPGNLYVTNSLHGYSFLGSTISSDNSGNYAAVIQEIDAGRPVHWSVGSYLYQGERIYHSICAVGYDITESNDSFVVIHNTWDKAEHSWVYQTSGSYSNVYPLIPGGKVDYNLRLESFNTTNLYFSPMKYPLVWQEAGNVSEVKIWSSELNGKKPWVALGTVKGGQKYFLLDMTQEFTGKRLNIEAYSNGTLVAADATPGKLGPYEFPQVAHFTPKGHVIAQGFPMGRTFVRDNAAYVVQGSKGVRVIELHDDYLFPRAALLPHTVESIAVDGNSLYLLGKDSLSFYDISNPCEPLLKATVKLASQYKAIAAYSGYLYLGNTGMPLRAMRRDNNQLLEEISLPESTVVALNVIGDELYVSAGTKGIRVYNLSSPGSPQYEKSIATKGSAGVLSKINSTLVVAEGSKGFELIDMSSGNSQVITPGSVVDLKVASDRIYVAAKQDGLFIYKITGSSSAELLGQFKPIKYGSTEGVAVGEYIYIGNGFDGFFSLESDLVGIDERVRPEPARFVSIPSFSRRGLSLGTITLSQNAEVLVALYDAGGRRVMALRESFAQGANELPSIPRGLAAGVYFVNVVSGSESFKAKVIVTN